MKLAQSESHTIKATPSLRWNDTSIDIDQNENYEFTAKGCRIDLYDIFF